VPYDVNGAIDVVDAASLTLAPGTEFVMEI
jgi:hypothetical protein